MIRPLQVALALVLASTQAPDGLSDLTVPDDLLPAGCTLPASRSERLTDGRTRGGLWAGLPITSNPWQGTDPVVLAHIRERMLTGLNAPDGPPLDRRALAGYRLKIAADLEAGYAAVYAEGEPSSLIVVYAVRFSPGTSPLPQDLRVAGARFVIGGIEAVVHGQGPCFQAVGAHLKSLAN